MTAERDALVERAAALVDRSGITTRAQMLGLITDFVLAETAELRSRYEEQCELTQEMRMNVEVYRTESAELRKEMDAVWIRAVESQAACGRMRNERDDARGVLAGVTDCLNTELRQAGPLSAPQVEKFLELESLRRGIRHLGDCVAERQRQRDELRTDLRAGLLEAARMAEEAAATSPYIHGHAVLIGLAMALRALAEQRGTP